MNQSQIKQRPCVVIGTYDSYHSNHQVVKNNIDDDNNKSEMTISDFEQSTDLFSYCRSNYLFNPNRRNLHHYQINYQHQQHQQQQQQPAAARLKKLTLNQIKGPSGSVRGHKDVVRKSLENIKSINGRRNFNSTNFQSFSSFQPQQAADNCYSSLAACSSSSLMMQLDEQHNLEYLERLADDELGQCVAYTTTLGVIRRTFEDSKLLRSILSSNLIKYEERDIYLNQEYKRQLKLRCNAIQVPVLFVDGKHFGGIKEVELMNEDGSLAIQLAHFKMSEAPKGVCRCCGNAKFIACQSCHGSRKSAVHHFKYNSIALRCIKCDKNDGLVECPLCSNHNSNNNFTEVDNNNNNICS